MGFCSTGDAVAVAEATVTVQRDWGDRSNRKHARLKYTIEDRGLDAFRTEVEHRAGVKLQPAKPFSFTSTGDRYGWTENDKGARTSRCSSRMAACAISRAVRNWLTGLCRIAEIHSGDFRSPQTRT